MFRIFSVFLTLLALPAWAQSSPQFSFPVDCTLGETCLTANYVDVAPDETHQDFMCNSKTYDDHKGVDFALKSRTAMKAGVNVLAARDGTISRVRDGESDTRKTETEYQAIRAENKDCGNGVLIDHGQGLQTFYCHMKQGSITVKPGDDVTAGQTIGQVGQSGFAEFPHLHFSVIWEGGHIDPFTGHLKEEGCRKFKDNMWEEDLAYEPYALFDGGFREAIPNFDHLLEGEAHPSELMTHAPALVYWIGFYHAKVGDQIDMVITDPNGHIFRQRSMTIEKDRKRPNFYYTGRKLSEKSLIPGIYTGTATFKRTGAIDQTYTHTITVKAP